MMEKVNKLYFLLTIAIGVMCTVLVWIPAMFGEMLFGDYTVSELAPIQDNQIAMMATATAALILLTAWNTWQLVKRSQVLRSSGVLQNSINLILVLGEAIGLLIILALAPHHVVKNYFIVAAIPVALSLLYWIICAFVLRPNK